jgi:hypothetical protein
MSPFQLALAKNPSLVNVPSMTERREQDPAYSKLTACLSRLSDDIDKVSYDSEELRNTLQDIEAGTYLSKKTERWQVSHQQTRKKPH